ncbi:hypothetical protein CJU89_5045 [Yarrowia sp. B02]|nr:hypothetical protein CJU89_5045 [Yarrowia sp. B02]
MSEELNKLILRSVTSCSLKDNGTFYFLFSHVDAGRRARYTVTFVDSNGKLSASPSFGLLVNDWLKNAIAIDPDTVLIVPNEGAPFTLVTTNGWKSLTIPSSDPREVLRMVIDGLVDFQPSSSNALTRMRNNPDHDFCIECEDGEIPVHSVVLKASWPFFDKLLDSKMQEAEQKRVKMPYPMEWIEPLVAHLYGEEVDMGFYAATGVIVTAAVYDLPALHALAMRRIRLEAIDAVKATTAWKRAFEAQNEALMEYCGAVVHTEMKNLPKVQHLLREFSEDEFLHLFNDMSLQAQKEATKASCQPKGPTAKASSPPATYNYTSYRSPGENEWW